MLDSSTITFLHGGCGLLVGTVDEAGVPHAARGQGVTVVSEDPLRLRLLIDVDDTRTRSNVGSGSMVAICSADVPTLTSLQLKGRVLAVEAATDTDVAKHRQYATDFIHDIHRTDGDPLEMLRRWAYRSVMAMVVEIDESFDQTPGPSAGRRVDVTT